VRKNLAITEGGIVIESEAKTSSFVVDYKQIMNIG